jgi:hypothetical protein
MEELARQGKVVVLWNGVNVSADIAPYISKVTYTDHEEGASDTFSLTLDDSSGLWSGDWFPTEGDTLHPYLGYGDALMDCGLFQVDEVTVEGPPSTVEVKALAAGFTLSLRTRNSRAFEAQTLRQIARYFCAKHSLTLVDNTSGMLSQINLTRKTQKEQTDLCFLSELASEYGFIFSIRGSLLVFTSYYELDNAASVKSLDRNELSSYSLTVKTYDTYASGLISRRDAKSKKVVKWGATDVLGNNTTDQALFTGRVENHLQAEGRVKGGLWRKNRFKQSGTLNDLPGDPSLVAGINFDLTGMGTAMSGQYHITVSTHTLSGDGAYTTSVEVRQTGTIMKPLAVPKTREAATGEYDSDSYDYGNTQLEDQSEDAEDSTN